MTDPAFLEFVAQVRTIVGAAPELIGLWIVWKIYTLARAALSGALAERESAWEAIKGLIQHTDAAHLQKHLPDQFKEKEQTP